MLTITSFIVIAVFGFSAMGHDSGHGYSKICIATAANGFECPPGTNLADFHLSAFKTFSNATLFVYSLLVLFMALWTLQARHPGPRPVLEFQIRSRGHLLTSHETSLKHWLSLHENSPSRV